MIIVDYKMDYKNINLLPRKCIVNSRSECDTSIVINNRKFRNPIIPANMSCVINEDIAVKLASNGYFYIMHRFDIDIISFCKNMRDLGLFISISVGVNQDTIDMLNELYHIHSIIPDFITIDIAHGHSIKMEETIKFIRSTLGSIPFIIAGNVCTERGLRDLESWGANAVKIGIGPGSACTTYMTTGFGSRGIQPRCLNECYNAKRKTDTIIIADGGIQEPGDIAKSLVLGADMVMIGGMFSALIDSPGTIIEDSDGNNYKEFWGSASAFQSGKKDRIEGTKKRMLLKDKTFIEEMDYLNQCLQSAISYAGGNDISVLKSVDYIFH